MVEFDLLSLYDLDIDSFAVLTSINVAYKLQKLLRNSANVDANERLLSLMLLMSGDKLSSKY